MKYPIRILHIVTTMNRGGLETMLMNYYRHIDRSKVQFDFLVHRDFEADYDKEIIALGGKIYHISRLIPWSKEYKNRLKEFFKSHPEYKIVHVHQDCLSSVALCCAKECGIPVRIAHSHNSNQDKNWKYIFKLFYMKKIPTYATDFFACGKMAGEWMFNGNNFHIMNNAIDAKAYSFNSLSRDSIRKEFHISNDSFVVGHVGRFMSQKNHAFIIDIFNQFHKKHPDSYLMLVGEGELKSSIQDKVKSLGLEDYVIFTGIRSDVNELLQAMDVFLFPSLYEGLPVSIIEAQAAGLPCLISDKVPIECKKTDLVYQLNLDDSVNAWSDKVFELSHITRRDTYEEIKESGFDIVENAKWLENFYINLYKKAMGRE